MNESRASRVPRTVCKLKTVTASVTLSLSLSRLLRLGKSLKRGTPPRRPFHIQAISQKLELELIQIQSPRTRDPSSLFISNKLHETLFVDSAVVGCPTQLSNRQNPFERRKTRDSEGPFYGSRVCGQDAAFSPDMLLHQRKTLLLPLPPSSSTPCSTLVRLSPSRLYTCPHWLLCLSTSSQEIWPPSAKNVSSLSWSTQRKSSIVTQSSSSSITPHHLTCDDRYYTASDWWDSKWCPPPTQLPRQWVPSTSTLPTS